MKSKP